MGTDFWHLISTNLMVACSLMGATWILARLINNAGVVDVAWALGFSLLAGVMVLLGTGWMERKLVIGALVAIWSLRLGIYLWVRVASHHPGEDGRYATLRAAFPRFTWLMFFGFFQLQAILLVVLSVPFAVAGVNYTTRLGGWEIAGIAIWVIAMAGEAIADHQLNTFRNRPDSRGKTCRVGLWRYSRHPNYFFEWLVWVAYAVFAMGSAHGWVALYCPLLMLFFLFRVTGIPATEAQAVKSRGDDYREYQRTTSAFVPWFPKKS